MNPPSTDFPSWSRPRWIWSVVFVVLLQFGAIYILSDFNPLHRRQPPPMAHLVLINRPELDQQLTLSLAAQDPTLFALAGKSNVSGAAWLNLKPMQHSLYRSSDQSFWIEPRIDGIRQLPSHLILQATLPDSMSQLKPLPRLQDLFVTNEMPSMDSVLRVEGPLAHRLLSSAPDLPTFTSTRSDRPLNKTVVQVAVDARGRVVSARLWESSQLPKADSSALQYARLMRFKPLPFSEQNQYADFSLEWSLLFFEWATIDAPVPATASNPSIP